MWLFSPKSDRPRSCRPSYRPHLEGLEDRCVPSSSPLDPTFGSGGIVTTRPSTFSNNGNNSIGGALAVLVQTDGKIVAAGSAQTGKGTVSQALVRYTTAGGLDTTFGGTGKVHTTIGAGGRFYGVAQ